MIVPLSDSQQNKAVKEKCEATQRKRQLRGRLYAFRIEKLRAEIRLWRFLTASLGFDRQRW